MRFADPLRKVFALFTILFLSLPLPALAQDEKKEDPKTDEKKDDKKKPEAGMPITP